MCFIVRKITLELERAILTTLYHAGAKNNDRWQGHGASSCMVMTRNPTVVPTM
jgi:hypothetical protein